MNFEQSMDYLEDLKKVGFILGLDNIKALMQVLDRPDKDLKIIHVAGTNGKGSTCTYLYHILKSAGYRTGIYTSPSLIRFNERLVVNGEEISDQQISELLTLIKGCSEEHHIPITAFEAETALAILFFAIMECDVVVLEVGLGGRLDATNFVEKPICSVITSIGLDHLDFLGSTIEEIASEKAGIIKAECPVVIYQQDESVLQVLREEAISMDAPVRMTDNEAIHVISRDLKGQIFDYKDQQALQISMLGEHQTKNAALAIEVIELLREKDMVIEDTALRQGLLNAVIKGRFQVLSKDPVFIVDGAHNPQGVESLVATLEKVFPDQKILFIFGTLKDKDYRKSIEMIKPIAKHVVTTRPDSDRALSSIDLKNELLLQGVPATAIGNVRAAINIAQNLATKEDIICCFGSLYQVGEVLQVFESKPF